MPYFGVRWAKSNPSPEGERVGNLWFGANLPSYLGLGGYLVSDSHERVKLSAADHNFLESGEATDLTGAAGHYQWGWNVPFYYQVYEDDDYLYETISLYPRHGMYNYYIPIGSRSCAGYATIDHETGKLVSVVSSSSRYRGGNNDAQLDEAFNSQLCMPATKMNIEAFRTAARRNGTRWFANERVMQYITAALKRIIFGNRNIQAAFNATLDSNGLRQGGTGAGIDMPANWGSDWKNYPYVKLNVGIDKGDFTGLLSTIINDNGTQKTIGNIPSFYGLKNDYKYLAAMSENMLLQCNDDKSQSLFISRIIDGSLMSFDSVDALTEIAKGPVALSAAWLFAKGYTLKNLAFFPKEELGGSGSTFYCDGYYNPALISGLRGALLLGDVGYGVNAGSVSISGGGLVTTDPADLGAFLCEWAEEFTTEPFYVE